MDHVDELGGLDPVDRLMQSRPRDAIEARRVASAVEARLFDRPAARVVFGRYVLLERLGAGGGGVVHLAYDPVLDRKVAIKLLHWGPGSGDGSDRAEPPLLREAQSLARLAHPNVIAVFDVGTYGADAQVIAGDGTTSLVDEAGRGVYVVMERVEGPTLDAWLASRNRSWREVVAVFAQAGRGLAAAHEKGLVHRDFKPANVVVGSDGRVRVLDFGLALAVDVPAAADGSTEDPARGPVPRNPRAGTPAYMAPEQHRGEAADARSDQYAFCVALFEGLYGRRPFSGRNDPELAAAKAARPVVLQAASNRVPGRIEEAVLRGLDPDPARRFTDMTALVGRLEADPHRGLRLGLGLGAATVLAGAVGWGGWAWQRERAALCSDHERMVAGVWDPATRTAARDAFLATGRGHASSVWGTVEAQIDAWVESWSTLRRQTCRATLIDGVQPMSVMNAKMLCLDRGLTRLGGLTRSFLTANAATVDAAVQAAAILPQPRQCSAVAGDAVAGPGTARADVLAFESRIADVEALVLAGHFEEAEREIASTIARAAELHDDALAARAHLAAGELENARGDYAEGEMSFRTALYAAERAQDAETVAVALSRLILVVGSHLARYREGMDLADLALAHVEAHGLRDPLIPRILIGRCRVEETGGRYDDALASAREALDRVERMPMPDPQLVGYIHNMIGVVLDRRGQFREALAEYEHAHAIRRDALGETHPDTINAVANAATARTALGDYGTAEQQLASAIDGMERTMGPDHPRLAWFVAEHAQVLSKLGRTAEAHAQASRALIMRQVSLGPGHPEHSMSLVAAAEILIELDRAAEALTLVERALRQEGDSRHPRMAWFRAVHGVCLRALGRPQAALPVLEAARELAESSLGPGHRTTGDVLVELGETELALGMHARALASLTAADAIAERTDVPEVERARRWFLLARAVVVEDRDLARTHARRSRAAYAASGLHPERLRQVEAWLASP